MQIPSLPPLLMPNAVPQDAVAKAAPHMQSAPPLTHRPVAPSVKAEKFRQFKQNRDGRNPSGDPDDGAAPDRPRDGGVDLSV